MIKDRRYDRAVQVTVIHPESMNVTNVQELAEKAWWSVNKTITIGQVDGAGQEEAAPAEPGGS